ncbi:MAG: flavin reductase family protein [Streptosporangiales bacterium]
MTSEAPAGERDFQVAFRGVLGRFATGVTVMTTLADGVDHAMTASAFCSVSMEPPLVLICVDRRNRIHDALVSSGSWGVSVLAQDGRDAATWLARRGRALEGQLDPFAYSRGEVTGAALFDNAIAWLECRTWQSYDGGDHTIVVGEVLSARVWEDRDDPLLYYRSHYGLLVPTESSEKNSGPIDPSVDSA